MESSDSDGGLSRSKNICGLHARAAHRNRTVPLDIFGNDSVVYASGRILVFRIFKAAVLGPLILEKLAVMDNIEGRLQRISYLFKFLFVRGPM